MERPKSRELFARAKKLMPGGVNSPSTRIQVRRW